MQMKMILYFHELDIRISFCCNIPLSTSFYDSLYPEFVQKIKMLNAAARKYSIVWNVI